jgi:hypothetical protein
VAGDGLAEMCMTYVQISASVRASDPAGADRIAWRTVTGGPLSRKPVDLVEMYTPGGVHLDQAGASRSLGAAEGGRTAHRDRPRDGSLASLTSGR